MQTIFNFVLLINNKDINISAKTKSAVTIWCELEVDKVACVNMIIYDTTSNILYNPSTLPGKFPEHCAITI